jgi:hypothetical protein
VAGGEFNSGVLQLTFCLQVMCNKFVTQAAVTALIWPLEGPIVVCLSDGKVSAEQTRECINKVVVVFRQVKGARRKWAWDNE